MIGFQFGKYDPKKDGKPKFDQLLDIFMQLITYTNGDVGEALQWMNQLDKEYAMTELRLMSTPSFYFNGRLYNLSLAQDGFLLRIAMERARASINCQNGQK